MKKIIITLICIVLFILILAIVIVNFSSLNYNKNLKKVETSFINNNNNIKNVKVGTYYSNKTYYIIQYEEKNIAYISVLNSDMKEIIKQKKDSLSKQKKDYIIGYKYDKLIYEYKKNTKDGFVYLYYDAITGEFIKDIKLSK